MIYASRLTIISMCLLLAACSMQAKKSTEEEQDTDVLITPSGKTSKPVLSLIEKARTESRQGNIAQARADIERAIRIEPRNPSLWHYLGKLSLKQSKYKEAINFALKSNQLSTDNKMKSDNWRILAHARYQLGDVKGAQRAQARARSLQD